MVLCFIALDLHIRGDASILQGDRKKSNSKTFLTCTLTWTILFSLLLLCTCATCFKEKKMSPHIYDFNKIVQFWNSNTDCNNDEMFISQCLIYVPLFS